MRKVNVMKMTTPLCSFVGLLLLASLAQAHHPCASPLVLDFTGNGVALTDVSRGVRFDINADGLNDRISWVYFHNEQALLWLDLNRNGHADDGSELFGTATRLPNNKPANNGFHALAQYDVRSQGGNEDGAISPADKVWSVLRLWSDDNQNGKVDPNEVMTLDEKRVVSIGLSFDEAHEDGGEGNVLAYKGKYTRLVTEYGRTFEREQDIVDVIFASPPEPDRE